MRTNRRYRFFRSHSPIFQEWPVLLGFLLAAVLLWGINLGGVPLRDWDEGTNGIIAKELYRSGHWIYLTLHGEPRLIKPPLLTWLIGLGYYLGGVHEWTTRLFPTLVSALSVPLLYLVGRSLFEQQQMALAATWVYLTLLPVVRHGRLAMHDGIIVSAFVLLLLCCLKARRHRIWAVGIGIALGIIGLTKGILVLLLGAIVVLFLLSEGEWDVLCHPYTGLGLLLGGIPLVGWYGAQGQKYGALFWQTHFFSQSLDRVWQPVEGNQGPIWYYLLEILKYGWPWLLFWPMGIALVWQYRYQTWAKLTGIGTVLFLGTISIMQTKLPWYVLPVYPFVALAIAPALAQVWQARERFRPLYCSFLAFLAIVAGLAGVGFGIYDGQPTLILLGITLALTFGISSWQLWGSDRQFYLYLVGGMYLSLLILMISPLWLWELNEAFPVRPVAELVRQHTPPGAAIYTSFAYNRPSLDFYSDRWIKPMGEQPLTTLWQPGVYLLLDAETLKQAKLPAVEVLGQAAPFTLIHHP